MTSLSTSTHLTIQTMMEYAWLFRQQCRKNESLILSTCYRDYEGNFINEVIVHQYTSFYLDHDGICDHFYPFSLRKENNHDLFILLFVFIAINIEKNKTVRPILGRSCRFIFNVGTWLWTSGRMCFIRCGSISSKHCVTQALTNSLTHSLTLSLSK